MRPFAKIWALGPRTPKTGREHRKPAENTQNRPRTPKTGREHPKLAENTQNQPRTPKTGREHPKWPRTPKTSQEQQKPVQLSSCHPVVIKLSSCHHDQMTTPDHLGPPWTTSDNPRSPQTSQNHQSPNKPLVKPVIKETLTPNYIPYRDIIRS